MIENTIGFSLFLLGLISLSLQRFYSSIPAHELKRLAARGDRLSQSLYRVVAYGQSLRLLLWSILLLSFTFGAWLVVLHLPVVLALVSLLLISAVAFVLLPALRLTQRSAQFAAFLAKPIAKVLLHIHRPLDYVARQISRHRDLTPHTHLYEKSDLRHVLEVQKEQAGNRITRYDLELARRTLDFGDKQAADIVVSRQSAYLVSADDTIGPILLDQLHKQRQASFLVYQDTPEHIIGSVAMNDAVRAKHGGRVASLVRRDLTFVREDSSLRTVLHAFQSTGQQVAVVINEHEEFVGVITLQAVLQELLGETIDGDDINYESPSAVAAQTPREPREVPEVTASQEVVTEVIQEAAATEPASSDIEAEVKSADEETATDSP